MEMVPRKVCACAKDTCANSHRQAHRIAVIPTRARLQWRNGDSIETLTGCSKTITVEDMSDPVSRSRILIEEDESDHRLGLLSPLAGNWPRLLGEQASTRQAPNQITSMEVGVQ